MNIEVSVMFKADMKSYIQRETAAIFLLSNLSNLKQGINYVYVMVDLICMGLLELQVTQIKREIKNKKKKFLPTVGFEPGTF